MSNIPEIAKVYKGEVLIQPYSVKKQWRGGRNIWEGQ
jgi:hypothetical protein